MGCTLANTFGRVKQKYGGRGNAPTTVKENFGRLSTEGINLAWKKTLTKICSLHRWMVHRCL